MVLRPRLGESFVPRAGPAHFWYSESTMRLGKDLCLLGTLFLCACAQRDAAYHSWAALRGWGRSDPLLAARPDQPRQRVRPAAGVGLRHRRRVSGLRDAVQPHRRRRDPVRRLPEAAGDRAGRRDAAACAGASTPSRGARSGTASGSAGSSTGATARSGASISAPATISGRSTPRPAAPRPASGRAARSTCARGSGRDPGALSVTLTTPGVVFRDLLIVGSLVSEALALRSGRHPCLRTAHG